MRRLALLAALSLAACGTVEKSPPDIVTVEVKIPTPVSCVPDNLPPAPAYSVTKNDLLEAHEGPARYQLAVGALLEREQRLAEVEPVIRGCKDVAPPH